MIIPSSSFLFYVICPLLVYKRTCPVRSGSASFWESKQGRERTFTFRTVKLGTLWENMNIRWTKCIIRLNKLHYLSQLIERWDAAWKIQVNRFGLMNWRKNDSLILFESVVFYAIRTLKIWYPSLLCNNVNVFSHQFNSWNILRSFNRESSRFERFKESRIQGRIRLHMELVGLVNLHFCLHLGIGMQ